MKLHPISLAVLAVFVAGAIAGCSENGVDNAAVVGAMTATTATDAGVSELGAPETKGAATVPSVCLGSIDLSNAGQVFQAGARMICAVRCVNQARDPASVILQLKAICDSRANV